MLTFRAEALVAAGSGTLSETGQAIARQIAWPIVLGYTRAEIANPIGITNSSVQPLLNALAAELSEG